MFTLHWASYDETSSELDLSVVGVFDSLAEAEYKLQENIDETVSYYEETSYTIKQEPSKTTFTTAYGYTICYSITEF